MPNNLKISESADFGAIQVHTTGETCSCFGDMWRGIESVQNHYSLIANEIQRFCLRKSNEV